MEILLQIIWNAVRRIPHEVAYMYTRNENGIRVCSETVGSMYKGSDGENEISYDYSEQYQVGKTTPCGGSQLHKLYNGDNILYYENRRTKEKTEINYERKKEYGTDGRHQS